MLQGLRNISGAVTQRIRFLGCTRSRPRDQHHEYPMFSFYDHQFGFGYSETFNGVYENRPRKAFLLSSSPVQPTDNISCASFTTMASISSLLSLAAAEERRVRLINSFLMTGHFEYVWSQASDSNRERSLWDAGFRRSPITYQAASSFPGANRVFKKPRSRSSAAWALNLASFLATPSCANSGDSFKTAITRTKSLMPGKEAFRQPPLRIDRGQR